MVDIIAARTSRVVLLTDKHIAYLFAKQASGVYGASVRLLPQRLPSPWTHVHTHLFLPNNFHIILSHNSSCQNVHTSPDGSTETAVTYKVKWIVQNSLVDNIRGVEKTYRISIEYRKPISVRAWCGTMWKIECEKV